MARQAYGFVMELFNFTDLDSVIHGEMSKSSMRGGIMTLTFISVVYLGYVYDTLPASSLIHSIRPSLTSGLLMSSAIYFGLITLPFLFLWTVIHQSTVFLLSRLFKGSGSFSTQYFMTSFITLAVGTGLLGFIPVFILSVFLPCFNLFYVLLYLVAAIYLALYVQARMLVAVHRISFPAALFIALLTFVAFVIAFGLLQFVLFKFGLGPDFAASFGEINPPGVNLTDVTTVNIINNSTAIR